MIETEEVKIEEIPAKTGEIKPLRDSKGRLLPGQSGNPKGRPKEGKFSLTTEQIRFFRKNPKEFITFLESMRLKEGFWSKFWDKVDANPPQDLNLGGEVTLPFKIIIESPLHDNSNILPGAGETS